MRGIDQRIVELPLLHVGLADDGQRRALLGVEQAFHGGQRRRLVAGDRSCPGRRRWGRAAPARRHEARDHAQPDETSGRTLRACPEAGRTRRSRPSRSCAVTTEPDHVVQVLPERPRIQQQGPETGRARSRRSGRNRVADGMLHPGVGGDDEEAGKPRAHEDQERRHTSAPSGPRRFSPNRNRPRKLDSRKNEKTPFHGQRLSDDAAGGLGKARPVGAELEFHGDAGDHAHGEIDGEDLRPEARGVVVVLVAGAAAPSSSESR